MLHKYNDGSTLIIMSAKELITIPVWKGNRILDNEHATNIKMAIGDNIRLLDSNYSIVRYEETTASGDILTQSYLIDGQHRASVIREYYRDTVCEPDFTLTVREKIVETESDAVEYFNALNNVKRQFWKTDPNLIVNKYIQAMEKKYNTNTKTPLIRPKAHRPYLSSDKLRDVLLKCSGFLKNSNDDIAKLVKLSAKENVSILNNLEMRLLSFDKNKTTIEKALQVKFGLAYDTDLNWIKTIVQAKM